MRLEFTDEVLDVVLTVQNDPQYLNRAARIKAMNELCPMSVPWNLQRWRGAADKASVRAQSSNISMRNHNDTRIVGVHRSISSERYKMSIKRWFITCAQNNTTTHEGFLKAIRFWLKENDATLLVPTIYYKNENLFSAKEPTWYDHELVPHLVTTDIEVCPGVVLLGGLKTQATAPNPLSAISGLPRGRAGIVGHSQVRMESLPVVVGSEPRLLHTTGSVTLPRIREETKTGKLYLHHHQIAGLILESDGDTWWFRQAVADHETGAFIDKDKRYSSTGIKPAKPSAGLVLGDVHVWKEDKVFNTATFGPKGLVQTIKPQVCIVPDVLDFYSASHHHDKDEFKLYQKFLNGQDDVEQEFKDTGEWLQKHSEFFPEGLVVQRSNHDEHPDRWLKTKDRVSPNNAPFFHKLKSMVYDEIKKKHAKKDLDLNVFRLWFQQSQYATPKVLFLTRNTPFAIRNIAVEQHGDRGVNGARGGKASFSRAASKMITAHTHEPCIIHGWWSVGSSAEPMEYEQGLTTHMQAHASISDEGHRTLWVGRGSKKRFWA